MRVAYADPPYIGQARKHYGPEAREVNHEMLVRHLCEFDGWALSCSSPSLREILPLCPPETRVAAWVKPFCSFKPNVNPAYAWEPVLFVPARSGGRDRLTVRDWVAANITLKKGLSGAKPEDFCLWLFDLLGMDREDEFSDLFPGSGVVMASWSQWRTRGRQEPLFAMSNPPRPARGDQEGESDDE